MPIFPNNAMGVHMKRQNICGYCLKAGHNKRTCQEYFKFIMENPNSYSAKKYQEMKEGSNRACSYCHQPGHNKATCNELADARLKAIFQNQKYRKIVLNLFKEYKIAEGAILSFTQGFPNSHNSYLKPQIALIYKIDWNNIIFKNTTRPGLWFKNAQGNLSDFNFRIDERWITCLKNGTLTVLAGVEDVDWDKKVPKDWLRGATGLERIFDDLG